MEKRKRSRKKDYSETSSALICIKSYYCMYNFTVIFRLNLYESLVQPRLNSCCNLTVELVTNNVCVYCIVYTTH